MACPFCVQLGMLAANYALSDLVKHIAKRHPVEGTVVTVVGSVLIIWGGPKVLRALSA
jgi:hypothetical protein